MLLLPSWCCSGAGATAHSSQSRPVTNPGAMGELHVCCSCGGAAAVVHVLLQLQLLCCSSLSSTAGVVCAHNAGLARGACCLACSWRCACACTPHWCWPLLWLLVVVLWGCTQRMPSFPVGAGSALDAQQLLAPSYPPCFHGAARHGVGDCCRAGCHLWGARGCHLVSDYGLPGPVLIGLLSVPLCTQTPVCLGSSLREGNRCLSHP